MLAQLDLFQESFARGLVMPDFQLMISPGHVEVADAMDLYPYDAPPSLPRRMARAADVSIQQKRLDTLRAAVLEGMELAASEPSSG